MGTIAYRVSLADGLELDRVSCSGPSSPTDRTGQNDTFTGLEAGDYTVVATATATSRTDKREVRNLGGDETRTIGLHID